MLFPGLHRRLLATAALPLLLLPIALGACGDDDSSATPTPYPTTTASTAVTTSTTSPSGSVTSGDAATGDQAYLKSVCTAANDAINPVIDAIGKDPSIVSNPQKFADLLSPAISDLSDRLSQIKPPADLQQYQDDLIARFKDISAKAKDGQLKSINDFTSAADGAQPPQAVQDRLRAAARQVPECQQSVLYSSGLFG
jgi:hypothetical protein